MADVSIGEVFGAVACALIGDGDGDLFMADAGTIAGALNGCGDGDLARADAGRVVRFENRGSSYVE